jgi:formylglycine-generating enzyme required for sulfatase activity
VDVLIGKDSGSHGLGRSVIGPGESLIKTGGYIRNLYQLIVADNEGNIAAFDEVRRESADDTAGELRIEAMTFGKDYHFLLLVGYWEHDGDYAYAENKPPTLLAAGLKSQKVTGSGTVTITMWPIVVDTKFVKGEDTVEAAVNGVSLTPEAWDLVWEVTRGASGTDGLVCLRNAQKAAGGGDTLGYRNLKTIVRGEGINGGNDTKTAAVLGGTLKNQITLGVASYITAGRGGKQNSANFNLEYVPFGLNDSGWSGFDEKSRFDLSEEGPVWIIRNGINDLAQNAATTFAGSGEWGGTKNGNGAVAFATDFVPVTGITGAPATGTPGTALALSGTVVPANATNKTIIWTVKDAGTTGATISGGNLNTTAMGTVTVTATVTNGLSTGDYTKDFSITFGVAADGVSLDKTTLTLKLGGTTTGVLTATVSPSNATDKTVTWTSGNVGVAAVSGGTVTVVAAGTAVITATTHNGKTATCTVTVNPADITADGISLDKSNLALKVDTTDSLTAVVLPSNATDNTVTWTSSNSGVVTVSMTGTVTAVGAGTAVITAKTHNNLTAVCNVMVSSSMAFVYVEGGTFQMGVEDGGEYLQLHEVTVSGFYMGKYEVTQAEWVAVMGSNPVSSSNFYNYGEDKPVTVITWYDAVTYCNNLSMKEGLIPAYYMDGTNVTWVSGTNGYRLPTEAEWEYAAKGGKNKDSYLYSGSDTAEDVAWYRGSLIYPQQVQQVGTKAPNSLGLYDMSGNVYEMCWDWYGKYPSEAQSDPRGPTGRTTVTPDRIRRGGSHSGYVEDMRVTIRNNIVVADGSLGEYQRDTITGFRVVRSLF